MTKSHDNSDTEAFVEAKSECLYCHQVSLLSAYETVECDCYGSPNHPAAKCPKCGKTIDVILVETKPNDNPPPEAFPGARTECPDCKTISRLEANRYTDESYPDTVWPQRTYFKCPGCGKVAPIFEIED
jgi:hypothetical protein